MRACAKRTKPLSMEVLCDWAKRAANKHATSKATGISKTLEGAHLRQVSEAQSHRQSV